MGLDQWFVATPTRDHSRDGVDKIYEIPHVFEYRKDYRLAHFMRFSEHAEWLVGTVRGVWTCSVSIEMLDEWRDPDRRRRITERPRR